MRVRYGGVVVVESGHWVCLVWPGSRLDKDDGVHFGEIGQVNQSGTSSAGEQ
jgi:hypothetical protein